MRLPTLLLLSTPLLSLALARGVNSGSGNGGGDGGGNGNGNGNGGGDDGSHSVLTANGTACAEIDNFGGTTVHTNCIALPTPPPGEEPHTRTDFYTSIGINTTVIFGPGYVDGHDGNHVSTGPVTYPLTGTATSGSAASTAASNVTVAATTGSKTASGTGAAATTAAAAGNEGQRLKIAGGVLGLVVGVVVVLL